MGLPLDDTLVTMIADENDNLQPGNETMNAVSLTKTNTATWSVVCKDHDCEAQDVSFIRKTEKDAERSAKLFRQCGYRNVTVKQFTA